MTADAANMDLPRLVVLHGAYMNIPAMGAIVPRLAGMGIIIGAAVICSRACSLSRARRIRPERVSPPIRTTTCRSLTVRDGAGTAGVHPVYRV